MRVLVLYRPNSEHARAIDEFIETYQKQYHLSHIEVLDVDSRDGSALATLYDVMQYPAILVLQADGQVQKSWTGESLPLMGEVASYASG
jgi:hypothetical protein